MCSRAGVSRRGTRFPSSMFCLAPRWSAFSYSAAEVGFLSRLGGSGRLYGGRRKGVLVHVMRSLCQEISGRAVRRIFNI